MRRLLIIALPLLAVHAHADCGATSPPSSYSVVFHAPACDAAGPCVQNKSIHFSITSSNGGCYIPFYPGPCPPPYAIDACDTLTWDFGDGTSAQIVRGSGEIDRVFPKAGSFVIRIDIRNGAGSGTIYGSTYICADPPSFVRFTKPVYDVAENGGSVTVTLVRSGDLSRAFTLDYTTFPNWPPGDFVRNLEPLAMKVSFAAGETVKNITHRVQDDAVFSGDSDHSVGVVSDGAAVMDGRSVTTAIIHVIEDERGPEFTIDDLAVPEGDGEHAVNFSLHLSKPATDRVYAWCVPHDGTAHAGIDFLLLGSTAIFEPGQTLATCQVRILGNTFVEPDKTFTVSTDPVQGPVTVKKGTALCTLINDDVPQVPPVPRQSLSFSPAAARLTAGVTAAVMLNAAIPANVMLRSSAPRVVQVDSSFVAPGLLRLVALTPGVAAVTATDGAASATIEVNVITAPRHRAAR